MFAVILNNTQFIAMFWTSYVTLSIIALFELVFNIHKLNIRVEELEFKYESKLHALSEQDIRLAELEKRVTIISQNSAAKMENMFHLTNATMMRVEKMDQTLKTHIIECRNSPKSAKQTMEQVSTETETYNWVQPEDQLLQVEEMISVETRERKRLAETTYTILFQLVNAVYQGTQDLTARIQNLNRVFWNKEVEMNVLDFTN